MALIPKDTEKRISQDFKLRVIELMDDNELTKKDLSKQSNISDAVLSRILIYGIIPSLGVLIKLANTFNVSLEYLLTESEDNSFYPSNSNATFQTRLHELMEEKNTKYSIIAHTMPFTKNYFYEWERTGTIPSWEYLKAIASHFKVSPDYLLGRTDDKN